MDDFGNGFDSEVLKFQISGLIGGMTQYWLFYFSGCEELTSKQSLYHEILLRGEPLPHY